MANPDDDDRTTINVKSVRKSDWEAARKAAIQNDDSMGTWLSDAIAQRITQEANSIEPPANRGANLGAKMGNPGGLTEDQITARMMALAALQQSAAAMKLAKVRASPILKQAQASLTQALPESAEPRGTISGIANGKERSESGQSIGMLG